MRILSTMNNNSVTDTITANVETAAEMLKNSTLNVFLVLDDVEDLDSISIIAKEFPKRFSVMISPYDVNTVEKLNINGIRWMSRFAIRNLRGLKAIKKAGAASFIISDSLLFQINSVLSIVNDATVFLSPLESVSQFEKEYDDIITSYWINPKSIAAIVKKYPQIGICTVTASSQKEKALISIYSSGIWNESLSVLLGADLPNTPSFSLSYLPDEFTLTRLNCGRKCDIGACHYCQSQFREIDTYFKKSSFFKSSLS